MYKLYIKIWRIFSFNHQTGSLGIDDSPVYQLSMQHNFH